MYKSGFILDNFEKIAAAIHNESYVKVWLNGELIDYGGVLISQTEQFRPLC